PSTAANFDALQSWPDCSRTLAVVALASESRQNIVKENIDGNYPDHHSGFVAAWCPSNMALQRKLGVLSERWAGSGAADRGDPRINRTVLTGWNAAIQQRHLVGDYFWLSFEWVSIRRLVMMTKARICVHSERRLPTTCPHFDSGSACL